MLRRALETFAFALAVLVSPCVSRALTNSSYGGYSIRVWQTEDGLPQNTVTAITQTHDGYLWIGTLGGLARFDGERFLNFDSGSTPMLPDTRISALFEDRDGTLWIGHDTGLVTRYRGGQFELLPGKPGARTRVAAIGADENGTIWLLRTSGMIERALPLESAVTPENPGIKLVRFARNAAGRIWFSVDGGAQELHAGEVRPIDLGPAHFTGYVRGLCPAAGDAWWVVRDNRIRKWAGGAWVDDRGPWGWSEINGSLELHDGSLAFATMDDGVHVVRPDGSVLVFNHPTAAMPNWARVVFEDREGNLWIGAGAGGLAAIRRTEFTVLNPPDNWQGRTALAVAPGRDGALWIGTEGAGVYRYFQNRWTHYGAEEGIENLFIWSVAADDKDRIWVGSWGGGIYRREGDRFVPRPELEVGAAPTFVLQFGQSGDALWLGTGNGILQSQAGRHTWLLHDETPAQTAVLAMVRDDRGVTWLALGDGGLGRLVDSKLQRFTQHDGLSGNGVQCLLPDGDALWIGTQDGGLNRFKAGRFSAIGVGRGLPSKVVCHIADDGQGYLWLSTHHGIFRVAKEQLNRCADGLIPAVSGQVYDKNDGLPTLEYSGGLQAAGCRTSDGRLWFTSSKGLVGVDPSAIRPNLLPPPVIIEALRIDGQPVAPGGETPAPLRLRPEHQRLEFQFTALSLSAPSKTLFKYRLLGLDQDWIEAGTKRTAFYSHLPAKNYRFQVIACNNDGRWNTVGASLGFTVLPFYWQTWWFRSGAVLLAVFAVGWGVRHETRRRMQRRVEELEYERGIERERARIAQDIHDDIGSSLTRITMLSQSVRQGTEPPYLAAPVLERIHDTALEVTHTLDEIVWALNPQHDTLDSLACYLVRFAQERLGEAAISCRLDLPLNLPTWPLSTQMRHNLLLAFKEALNNAIKHAAATEIQVSLELGRDEFVIVVQDNGGGFLPGLVSADPAIPRRGGNGLINLRQRLERIGGHCGIASAPGKGTRIAFTVRLPPGGCPVPPAPGSRP